MTAGLTLNEENGKVSLSKEEVLALYISQKGNLVSAEEVRENLIRNFDKVLDTESLRKSENLEIKTLWIKDELNTEDARLQMKKEKGDVPLYIFQNKNDKGFIIASGDIRLPQILAYAPKGTFDTHTETGLDVFCERLPLFMMDSLAKFEVKYESLLASAKEKLSATNSLKVSLRSAPIIQYDCYYIDYLVTGGVLENRGPLVQVEWGQVYPYDKFCPDLGCSSNYGHALVGCIGVACAQIMSYHKYPASVGGYSMNWNNMTAYPHITSLSSTYQDQIARLMHHVAAGVGMNFGCESSFLYASVSISNIRSYLSSVGYYSDNACNYDITTIKSSIANNRPLFVQGVQPSKPSSGHAWVIDGYKRVQEDCYVQVYYCDSTLEPPVIPAYTPNIVNYVHFNWGWNGSRDGHNGFYLSSIMSYMPKSTDPYSFTYDMTIIPNIRH